MRRGRRRRRCHHLAAIVVSIGCAVHMTMVTVSRRRRLHHLWIKEVARLHMLVGRLSLRGCFARVVRIIGTGRMRIVAVIRMQGLGKRRQMLDLVAVFVHMIPFLQPSQSPRCAPIGPLTMRSVAAICAILACGRGVHVRRWWWWMAHCAYVQAWVV